MANESSKREEVIDEYARSAAITHAELLPTFDGHTFRAIVSTGANRHIVSIPILSRLEGAQEAVEVLRNLLRDMEEIR